MSQSLMPPLKALFSPQGRMRRRDFWIYTSIFWAVLLTLLVLGALGLHMIRPNIPPRRLLWFCIVASVPFVIWSYVALAGKRLHDRNISMWYLGRGLTPITGWIWVMAECCGEGMPSPNAFGPSPKQIPDNADVF